MRSVEIKLEGFGFFVYEAVSLESLKVGAMWSMQHAEEAVAFFVRISTWAAQKFGNNPR